MHCRRCIQLYPNPYRCAIDSPQRYAEADLAAARMRYQYVDLTASGQAGGG